MNSSNQNTILVSSIQQYVNSINDQINSQNAEVPTLPRGRTITKAKPITRSNNLSPNETNDCYQLWSGVDLISFTRDQSYDSTHSMKRKISESSTGSTSPSSSIDSMHSSDTNIRKTMELPSTKASILNNGLNFLSAVKNNRSNLNQTCSFCKNNGEPDYIYTSHLMKNAKGKVTCPLLKIYKCPICGESGESAHTITYCKKYKMLKRNNFLRNLQQ